jgi:mycothiol system anti-sigma-R factor
MDEGGTVAGELLDCDQAMAKLNRYIDSEMPIEELIRMQHHLDSCGSCVAEMDAATRLRDLLRRSCIDQAPDALRERVAARLATMRQELAAAHR